MTPAELEEFAARASSAYTYADFHEITGRDVPALIAEVKRLSALVSDPDEDRGTGCCAKDGIDCPACMTGRCSECSECVHYEPRDDEDDAETEIRDWYDTHCSVTGELLDRPARQGNASSGG